MTHYPIPDVSDAGFYQHREPHSICPICDSTVNADGICWYCYRLYQNFKSSYDLPEPFTHDTIHAKNWIDILRITKNAQAAGKTQHEINVEIFNYAYHACNPNDSAPSPYLSICDIPAASNSWSKPIGYFSTCPICGESSGEKAYCENCAMEYQAMRYENRVPIPLTPRIFRYEHWVKIYQITKNAKVAGKTKEEINQLLTDYATYAVESMQTEVNNTELPPLPSSIIPYLPSNPTTAAATASSSAAQPPQIRQRREHPLDRFKMNQCYICREWYWTRRAADNCCKEAKKTTPPPQLGRRIPPVPTSPLQCVSDICPVCKGKKTINGLWCDYCQGRGTMRLY